MSMLPAASLGSPRRAPTILNQSDRDRARALALVFAVAAIAAGTLAAVVSYAVLAFAVALLLIVLAAWSLPLTWLGLVLAALIPFQFYLPVPATSLTMRAALVFVFAVAFRVIVDQRTSSFVFRPELALSEAEGSFVRRFTWLLPAMFFIVAAFVAAIGAQDQYAAFKGIFDWLVILVTAFTVAALRPSAGVARRTLYVLIMGGVLQALLGLLQYLLGLNTVLELLRLPISGLLYQPNLLKDKLADLSFNWVAFDRALPFGTFINGIDYAIFLAAILSLIIALIIARQLPSAGAVPFGGRTARAAHHCEEPRNGDEAIPDAAQIATSQKGLLPMTHCPRIEPDLPSAVRCPQSLIVLTFAAVPIAVGLLLTFKGSGLLALTGGMVGIAVLSLPRLSNRTITVGLVVLAGALLIALPFADLIGQRALFLVQREQGSIGSIGRLQIWASLFQFIAQRPLFGYGLNNAIALIAPQWTLRDGALGFVFSTPESAYVSALVEMGLVGLVALAVWLIMAVAHGYRRARAAKYGAPYIGLIAALVALVFGNLTVSGLTTDQNGMLLGMLIGMIYGSQKDGRD